VTVREPTDGRVILAHVGSAMTEHVKAVSRNGGTVPPEIAALLDVLLALMDSATPSQRETPLRAPAASPHARPMESLLLSRHEAARVLKRSLRSLDRAISAGQLPAVRVEGSTRIRRRDLEAYVERLPSRSFRDNITAKGGAA